MEPSLVPASAHTSRRQGTDLHCRLGSGGLRRFEQRDQGTHLIAQIIADAADIDIGAHHARGDDDQQLGAPPRIGGRAEQIAHDRQVVQERNAIAAVGIRLLYQATHDNGFAGANRHSAGELPLQEGGLLRDGVLTAHIGDLLIDRHGDEVAGIDRWSDLQVYAGVLVLVGVGGGAADGRAGRGFPRPVGLLRTNGDGRRMVVQHHERGAGHHLDIGLGRQGIEGSADVGGRVPQRVVEAHANCLTQSGTCGLIRVEQRAISSIALVAHISAEGPLQAELKAIIQRDLDNAGLDQHLGRRQVELLERHLDALEFRRRTPDQHGVVELVSHDTDVADAGRAAALATYTGLPQALLVVAETAIAKATVAETAVAKATATKAAIAETAVSETAVSEAAVAEATVSEATVSEATVSKTAVSHGSPKPRRHTAVG